MAVASLRIELPVKRPLGCADHKYACEILSIRYFNYIYSKYELDLQRQNQSQNQSLLPL